MQPEQRKLRLTQVLPNGFAMLGKDSVKRSCYFLCITLLMLCHEHSQAQVLTNTLPGAGTSNAIAAQSAPAASEQPQNPGRPNPGGPARSGPVPDGPIPDEPGRQLLPIARPEPLPQTGTPIRWEAREQTHAGDISTLSGEVVVYYKNYLLHADKIVYDRSTDTIQAEGHLQLQGGPSDIVLTASHGEIHVHDNTAAFYDVTGTLGVRHMGRTAIYSTPDPFIFTGRILLQTGENAYRVVDGSMTSCRLPHPDWRLISRSIEVADNKASTRNTFFEFWRIPLFYLPFLKRNLDETGRESGIMFDGAEDSGVKGLVFGEQYYWAINRSMDMLFGAQYWSKRGYAPNGNFRYRGPGLDAFTVRWDGLIDRGIHEALPGQATPQLVNQGGADVLVFGRKYFTPDTRVAGSVEYLSSYIYRLAFDENLAQATSSQVQSDLEFTHNHNGFIPALVLERFQTFAGISANSNTPVVDVPEARILHLPMIRFDAVDRPLPVGIAQHPFYWGLSSSVGDMDRAEPQFHARNVGRIDIYPHIEWPLHLGDWNILPELAVRSTEYTGSQLPDLTGADSGIPAVQHNALNRSDVEMSLDIRPPALERDYNWRGIHRQLRHVIEPDLFYRYVTGIHNAPDVLQFDTSDIATNTNEAGFSLTQRLYARNTQATPCDAADDTDAQSTGNHPVPNLDPMGEEVGGPPARVHRDDTEAAACQPQAREWASWQIAQKFFIDPNFGGALIPNRRNVFDSTLDLTGIAYLTAPRNIAPIVSRLRFEAVDNLRVEWDLDYDTIAGRFSADNLFAGYSFGRTTVGLSHALLNAADESGSSASVIQTQLVQPFLYFGKPSDPGLSVGISGSYNFTSASMQYGGAEAIYNWNCCGLQVGYRRIELGSSRDEPEWLWGFTLAGIGTAGDIHRSNSIFPTPAVLKLMY